MRALKRLTKKICIKRERQMWVGGGGGKGGATLKSSGADPDLDPKDPHHFAGSGTKSILIIIIIIIIIVYCLLTWLQ